MKFDTPQELTDFVIQRRKDSEDERLAFHLWSVRGQLYYLGRQWVSANPTAANRLDAISENYESRQGPIRAVLNRVTKNAIRAMTATSPTRLFVDAALPESGGDPFAIELADIIERGTNPFIASANALGAVRRANAMRTIAGSWGIGHRLEQGSVRSFNFDPVELSLDPTTQDADLEAQDEVVHSFVWTVDKIKRTFGEDFLSDSEVEKLGTVGQLKQWYIAAHGLSGGAMYGQYARRSRQKAAVVHVTYCKGDGDRFDRMYVGVQHAGDDIRWTNFNNPDNPFGGNGMPLAMVVGYPRPGSRYGIGDVHMQIDDQNVVNFLGSMMLQQQSDAVARSIMVADQRSFARGIDRKSIADQASSRMLVMDGADPNAQNPYFLSVPGADPGLAQLMSLFEDRQRDQAMRAEAHSGEVKSHVPFSSTQLAVELSEAPLDDRVRDDVETYSRWLAVLSGTVIRRLHERHAPTVSRMLRAGLDEAQIGALLTGVDPDRLPVEIRVRDQALRPQPRRVRKANLDNAIATGAISGTSARIALARDLDLALTEYDAHVVREVKGIAADVAQGLPFGPVVMTPEAHQALVEALQVAALSRRVRSNPELSAHVNAVLMAQRQLNEAAPAEPATAGAAPAGPFDGLDLQGLADAGQFGAA